MTQRQSEIIELIHKEVKPALGCTEPIAVALAAAKATEILCEKCGLETRPVDTMEITVEVSGNILKNGMGVGIPGTGMVGLHIAAALGAVCGKSEYGLEVLNELCPLSVEKAKELVAQRRVKVELAVETEHKLYVKAAVRALVDGCEHCGKTLIEDSHDRIVETEYDACLLSGNMECNGMEGSGTPEKSTLDYGLSVAEIYGFAKTVDYEDIKFILESRDMNLHLAHEGLNGKYGLTVGRTIADSRFTPVFGKDFLSYAMSLTAAASDARMAGCTLPAMSNSGSGNQGITVTMPVIAYALHYNVSDEELARALVLSHLVAIHIKGYLGKLSALCGCVIASTGSSCGLVYLHGGSYEQVCNAIKNMIGNITGMVCDGAKVGCAMKVASGVSSSVQSAVLALEGICISSNDGIIEDDIEKTIRNLGRIGSIGMETTDKMILNIMVCK